MFAIRHEMRIKIDDQKQFLGFMLATYPGMVEQWENSMVEKFKQEAKEAAAGDSDIEHDYFSQCCRCLDDTGMCIPLFYNTMLVMAYSYYESMLGRILDYEVKNKKDNAEKILDSICKLRDIELSKARKADVAFMRNTVRILRNQICHNNNGTPTEDDELKKIAQANEGVEYNGGEVYVNESVARKALEAAYGVLSELAEKLGYKTKFVSPPSTSPA